MEETPKLRAGRARSGSRLDGSRPAPATKPSQVDSSTTKPSEAGDASH
ncbi:hypothetical protein [Archangium lansingense]|uniref:Uncharacterized protein n=1 Tax=Archangium lansingense TaxID=2995310 RepID=A0ABT4A741_9BACT|nr:hypothetical protein [Archangium lansinium]MCY1077411.1 hypothetical protein [Archangium lansinium]